jgi:nitrate/nitrite transport system ATP-binding protein
MTNGPGARVAEIVENPLPKARDRTQLHHAPGYYGLRNHLMDFLVTRSKTLRDEGMPPGYDPRHPPVVRPALSEADAAAITGAGPDVRRA